MEREGGEPMDQLKGQSGDNQATKHWTMCGYQRNRQQRGHKLGGEGREWLQREIGEKHRRSRINTYSFKVWLVYEDTLKFALSHIYGPQHSTRHLASISWYKHKAIFFYIGSLPKTNLYHLSKRNRCVAAFINFFLCRYEPKMFLAWIRMLLSWTRMLLAWARLLVSWTRILLAWIRLLLAL